MKPKQAYLYGTFVLIGLLLYSYVICFRLSTLESIIIAETGSLCLFAGCCLLLAGMSDRHKGA